MNRQQPDTGRRWAPRPERTGTGRREPSTHTEMTHTKPRSRTHLRASVEQLILAVVNDFRPGALRCGVVVGTRGARSAAGRCAGMNVSAEPVGCDLLVAADQHDRVGAHVLLLAFQ